MLVPTIDQYEAITLIDFEFLGRRDWASAHKEGNPQDPICVCWHELKSGKEGRVWASDFGKVPPYRIDKKALVIAYYSSAEMGCHLPLEWARPANLLDLYVEYRNRINGLRLPVNFRKDGGYGLRGAMIAHGLDATDLDDKAEMRALVLRGGPWTPEERAAILEYCMSDVRAITRLFTMGMQNYIDLPRALIRGWYMWAAANMEFVGIPIDVESLHLILENWERIKLELIRSVDAKYGVYDGTSFKMGKFIAYLKSVGMLAVWPRTEKGMLKTDGDTLEEMVKSFPEIRELKELKSSTDKLKLASLTVGDDGRNRTILSAFASKTARNQPSNAQFVFLGDTWLRSVIKPIEGWAIAYLDYEQQEFGIAAALSKDPNMLKAYLSGDCYLEFAKMAGAIPAWVIKDSPEYKQFEAIRDQYKQCVLAVQYGQGATGLAARTGLPLLEAVELMQRHREQFRRFWQWSDRIVDGATFRLEIPTGYGWWLNTIESYRPESDCSERTIRNYSMQAGGSEMLRIACIRIVERQIRLCAPIHDAVLIEGRVEDIDRIVAEATDCMRLASRDVLDGFELRTEVKTVRWPDRFVDKRGIEMWNTVADLVGIKR